LTPPGADAGAGPGADPRALLEGLVGAVRQVLGAAAADVLQEQRNRSLADRLAGRSGRLQQVRFTGPDTVLTVTAVGERLQGESARVVRGVVISRQALPLGEWLTAFAGQLAVRATEVAGDAAAVGRALTALGVPPGGSDLVVEETDVDGGLAGLLPRTAGRLPAAAAVVLQRIVLQLREALPRVADQPEADLLLRRTATAYLPDTLRAYLTLPAEWARTHVLADGTTPEQALLAQLQVLEADAAQLHEAALTRDATALRVNGLFLDDRFGRSALELPDRRGPV